MQIVEAEVRRGVRGLDLRRAFEQRRRGGERVRGLALLAEAAQRIGVDEQPRAGQRVRRGGDLGERSGVAAGGDVGARGDEIRAGGRRRRSRPGSARCRARTVNGAASRLGKAAAPGAATEIAAGTGTAAEAVRGNGSGNRNEIGNGDREGIGTVITRGSSGAGSPSGGYGETELRELARPRGRPRSAPADRSRARRGAPLATRGEPVDTATRGGPRPSLVDVDVRAARIRCDREHRAGRDDRDVAGGDLEVLAGDHVRDVEHHRARVEAQAARGRLSSAISNRAPAVPVSARPSAARLHERRLGRAMRQHDHRERRGDRERTRGGPPARARVAARRVAARARRYGRARPCTD